MFHFSVFFITRPYRLFIVLGWLIQSHLLIAAHSPCAYAILFPFSFLSALLPPSEGKLKLGRRSELVLIVPVGFDKASSNINSHMKGGLDICKQSNKLLFPLLSSGMSRECVSQASVGEICAVSSQSAWSGLICCRQIVGARKETLSSETSAFRVCSSSVSGKTHEDFEFNPDLLNSGIFFSRATITDIWQTNIQLLLCATFSGIKQYIQCSQCLK